MNILKNIFIIGILSMVVVSCEVEDGANLNGPTTDQISSDISRSELIQATSGVLADMRTRLGTQIDGQSVAGREYWRIQSSDPRWTADLLTGKLDDNAFYSVSPYASRYTTIKGINLILEGLEKSTADFSNEEKAAAKGFLNTIKAHELLMVLNQQYKNGIRLDISDPKNLGPFVSYEEGLTAVFNMLTTAATDLSNGGSAFPLAISSGFSLFSTPIEFLKFNNALAARVEAYRGNYESVNTLLQSSFMNMSGDLSSGANYTFSLAGGDVPNPLFFDVNASEANARLAHPSFIADAEAGDTRLNKIAARTTSLALDGLTGTHSVFVYKSNTDPVSIIRNEELILLSAEANHISNPTAAVAAIDVIRTAAGLPAYSGGTSPAELVTEILKQRRYSLYAEGGHRWIDLRRFNKLSELPIDRSGDAIFDQFPTPVNENK
ncbi:RagB/SusD family nutrient uptake outer membrane protein [Aquimarina longa]|uniref:RagB/SusD family nutrient uptake outer membrane protein n=1 Tax=Aquimarina longa TaxID=1080221 RepID=UPI000781F3CF|nr:RagB/SusD family nutrient uptake outer membrane protein [Aquimarina longa]